MMSSINATQPLEPLLKVEEVAKLLAVSKGTIYRLAERGNLSCVKIGGRIAFVPSQLRLFIENGGSNRGRTPKKRVR